MKMCSLTHRLIIVNVTVSKKMPVCVLLVASMPELVSYEGINNQGDTPKAKSEMMMNIAALQLARVFHSQQEPSAPLYFFTFLNFEQSY